MNKLYASGKRHLVIINKHDKTYDCYTNNAPKEDYILRKRYKTPNEVDTWLHCEVLPLYDKERND